MPVRNAVAPHIKNSQTAPGVITAGFLALAMFLPPTSSAAPAWIPISECELNGFSLGGTVEQMRDALGEPDRILVVKPPTNDHPNMEYHYDGLRIAFSMSGHSAAMFVVTSGKYRLRSGLGVGSSREEIESTLGPATEVRSGDSIEISYKLTAPSGQTVFGQLRFKLENGAAVEIVAGLPSR